MKNILEVKLLYDTGEDEYWEEQLKSCKSIINQLLDAMVTPQSYVVRFEIEKPK